MNDSENPWSKNMIFQKDEDNNTVSEKKEQYENYKFEKKLFKALYKNRRLKRKRDFQDWLEQTTFDDFRIRDILMQMVLDVKREIKLAGFEINDENELKNNIATFIYNNSK